MMILDAARTTTPLTYDGVRGMVVHVNIFY